MNKVILKGRLTSDVELRQTASNISVARATLAVNRNFKNKETGEYEADFISLQAWRNNAEFLSKYTSKGQEILVEGTLQTGKYQDKNHSDVTHYTVDVVVDRVEFCGSKSSSSGESENKSDSVNIGDLGDFEEILSDGDVPF